MISLGLKSYTTRKKGKFVNGRNMALDMPYDLMDRRFSDNIMSSLDYSDEWIKKVINCVKSLSYAFITSGG